MKVCRKLGNIKLENRPYTEVSEYYSGVDGVEIITDANKFFVWQFRRNMLLLHHGDKAKP